MERIKQTTKSGPRLSDLETAIRGILDTDPSESAGVPPVIRELSRLRSATRRVLEALEEQEIDSAQAGRLLRRLLVAAESAALPGFASRAVWLELDAWRDAGIGSPPAGQRTEIAAAQTLSRAGYDRCPVCLRDVLRAIEIARLTAAERRWRESELRHARASEESA